MINETIKAVDAAIVSAVRERVQLLAETELKQVNERMRARIAEIAAGVALDMQREISTQTLEDRVVITVRLAPGPRAEHRF